MGAPLSAQRLDPQDPELLQRVEEYAAQGYSLNAMAPSLGTSHTTLYRWLDEAEAEEQRGEVGSHHAFREAFQRGLGKLEAAHLDTIVAEPSNKPGHWQRSGWVLERMFPERYGQRRDTTIKVTGKIVHGVVALPAQAETELLRIVQARLLEGTAPPDENKGTGPIDIETLPQDDA